MSLRETLRAVESVPVRPVMPAAVLRQEISSMVERLLSEDQSAINDLERRSLIRDIQHEMLGFGPLELLMADPTVSDILVNSYQ
jgi:pilus assembly protein CpaF